MQNLDRDALLRLMKIILSDLSECMTKNEKLILELVWAKDTAMKIAHAFNLQEAKLSGAMTTICNQAKQIGLLEKEVARLMHEKAVDDYANASKTNRTPRLRVVV